MTNSAETNSMSGQSDGHWEFACKLAELPEDELTEVEVGSIAVLLLHHKGEVFAFPPSCPHMEEPLKNGMFDNDECVITCTKHLWQWDAKSGAPIGLAECPLLKYQLKTDAEGNVFLDVKNELTYEFR